MRETILDSDQRIYFILPLHQRFATLQRFLKNYEQVCILGRQKTALLIILFISYDDDEDHRNVQLVQEYKNKYPSAYIRVMLKNETFSRARALDYGVSKLDNSDLMFFVDVDIAFTSASLDRIRRNTELGSKIYFPIVFSLYPSINLFDESEISHNNFEINELYGFWRVFGFGIVAIFKKDYVTIGGLDVEIKGWGKEDVNFFEKTLLTAPFQIIRSADPGLVHIYHNISCNNSNTNVQMVMCNGTLTDSYASTQNLAKLFYYKQEYMKHVLSRTI